MERFKLKTPIGNLEVEHQSGCLHQIRFGTSEKSEGANLSSRDLKAALRKYFTNPQLEFCVPFEITGTPFEKSVYLELWKTRSGETVSYQELARRVGRPKAFRAVAQAMAKNKLPLLIPCHRVINSNGKLGGFSGGLSKKKWLLDHERSVQKRLK